MNRDRQIQTPVWWMAVVTDRGMSEKIGAVLKEHGIAVSLVLLGTGTATQDMLNYLGLDQSEKEIVISLVKREKKKEILQALDEKIHFDRPGRGIVFHVPVTGVSALVAHRLEEEQPLAAQEKEEIMAGEQRQQELIAAVVEHGEWDLVMEAAKKAGARGGTLLKGRGLGSEEAEKFFSIMIQPEKDILFLLVEKEKKHAIMQSICDHLLTETGKKGVLFSMPVDDVMGLGGDR